MARILLLDHHKATRSVLTDLLESHEIMPVSTAAKALIVASEYKPDLALLELSLAGHSGLEFLYEFRTYTDWEDVPVIVYSTIRLREEVLHTRAWQQLGVFAYLYKPETTLKDLHDHIQLAFASKPESV